MPHNDSLRKSCEEHINRLSLPHRFTTRTLRDAIAELRGKPILLKPLNTVGVSNPPCGVRLETPQTDLVFYETGTSVHHQRHILTHELMHIFRDHPGSLEVDTPTAHALGVNPTLVLRMSGRTRYSTVEEREAEILATVVRHRMYSERQAPAQEPAKGSDRWEALFAQSFKKGRHLWS